MRVVLPDREMVPAAMEGHLRYLGSRRLVVVAVVHELIKDNRRVFMQDKAAGLGVAVGVLMLHQRVDPERLVKATTAEAVSAGICPRRVVGVVVREVLE